MICAVGEQPGDHMTEEAPQPDGEGPEEVLGPDGACWTIKTADGASHVACWYATGELYAGQSGQGMRLAGTCRDLAAARREVLAIRSRLNSGESSPRPPRPGAGARPGPGA